MRWSAQTADIELTRGSRRDLRPERDAAYGSPVWLDALSTRQCTELPLIGWRSVIQHGLAASGIHYRRVAPLLALLVLPVAVWGRLQEGSFFSLGGAKNQGPLRRRWPPLHVAVL